jgi:PAS domain S-box-containing protein
MKGNTRAFRDAVVIGIAAICVFVLAATFELFEAFAEWSEQHNEWAIDELAVVAAFLAVATAIFSRRRIIELRQEVAERKRIEEAQSRLASIVENSIDAIDSKTLDGKMVSLNPSARKLYGYSEQEIKGKLFSIFTPPERIDEMKEVFERVGRGEIISEYETERVSKDGRRIPLSNRIPGKGLKWQHCGALGDCPRHHRAQTSRTRTRAGQGRSRGCKPS